MSPKDDTDFLDDEFEGPPGDPEESGGPSNEDEDFEEDAEFEAEDFDEPDLEDVEEGVEAEGAPQGALAEFPEDLLAAHAQVESFLQAGVESVRAKGIAMAEDAFEGAGNVVGVGLGVIEDDLSIGPAPGEPCLNVYVAEMVTESEAMAVLAEATGVSAFSAGDTPVNVIVTGPIDAYSHRFRMRRAPGGVSVGHVKVTAGTLGCLARGRRPPRNRRLMILSNNHVLANSNGARFGDPIVQPGRADGGRSPRDRIAILERFVPINFGGRANYVDCATGWAWPGLVRRELVYLRGGRRRLFRIGSRPVGCRRGMIVAKSGRTTQLTSGRITDCNATIRVNYGSGRVALFRDQIAVRGLRGDFSRGGDSGSVIWTLNRTRNPVGLLFAGGGGFTFANKIVRVLRALDINLYT